jgi:hypothetical protein
VRRGIVAFSRDFLDDGKGALTRRAAGAKVTEKKVGFSFASCARVDRSFSIPSGVCGGKNSMESSVVMFDSKNSPRP